mgnify:CR=1 FL=1
MSSRPWYAWFPSDYRSKTAHLTFEQDSAYRRMLDSYYERRAPLPADLSALFRLCGAQSEGERDAIIFVSKEFFVNGDGLLKHARCDEQIAKEGRLIEEWREAGKRGASKRWGNDRVGHRVGHQNPNGVAIASYTQPLSKTHSKPDPRNNATWTAFHDAYAKRYGVGPVRNASVNTCIANIVKRLGDESPLVAAFYLTHNDQFYVKKRHSVKMLLADAEGLRTQWKTGNKATALEARSAETRDGLHEQYKRLIGENNA